MKACARGLQKSKTSQYCHVSYSRPCIAIAFLQRNKETRYANSLLSIHWKDHCIKVANTQNGVLRQA